MKIEAQDITDGMQVRFPFGRWMKVRFAAIGTEMVTIHADKCYRIPLTTKVRVK